MEGTDANEEVWGLASEVAPDTLAMRTPLSESQLNAMMCSITSRHLPRMTIFGGITYLVIALSQWSGSMDRAAVAQLTIFGLTGVAFLTFSWRAHRQPTPISWAPHVAGTIFCLVTATVTLAYAFTKNPQHLYFFLVVQVLASALVLHKGWLVAVMLFADVGWGVTSFYVAGVSWATSIGYIFGISVLVLAVHGTRRRTLVQLEEHRIAAERAAGSKTEFLANLSHEVRTPMSGVLGLSSLLLDSPLNPKQRKMVSAIRESTQALLGMVDEILDFSKLEKGQIALELVRFDVRELVEGVVELMRPRADAKGLTLQWEIDGVAETRVVGDAGRLRQVLLNFVNNAIKFTEWGFVLIRADQQWVNGKVSVRFSVRDTGIGIPQDGLEQIFDRYQQQDDRTHRVLGGTGLGLSISKQLIDLMGGDIGVASRMDEGTTFWARVTLDLAPDHRRRTTSQRSFEAIAPSDTRVLLVEDDPTNRMVSEALLRKFNCEVDVAENGQEAIKAIEEHRYALVLMDCHMPGLDGFGAARRIRKSVGAQEVPIIGLTANATDEDHLRCREAGMNDSINKPIRIEILRLALERWIGGRTSAPPSSLHDSDRNTPLSLDLDVVRELVSVGEEDDGFVQEVMVAYVAQLKESLEKLQGSVAAGDMEEVRYTAHSLKGASKQIGALRVGELLGAIERQTGCEEAARLIGEMADEVPRVAQAVRGLLRS